MGFALAGLLGLFLLAASAASGAPSGDSSVPRVSNAAVAAGARAPRGSAPRLRQVDGGPGYYGRFSNALPTKPSYFPIGVWFESVVSQRDVNLDKDVGLNTYVVLTTNSNLPLLRRNGMKAILQQEQWRPSATAGTQSAGWELRDEIDMQMSPNAGYAELLRLKSALPADGRLRYNNFGKGVMFWETNAEAARYVNAVDIPSTDVYWFSDNNVCGSSEGGRLFVRGRRDLSDGECHRASNYGAQVQRLRRLVSPRGSKPVWTFIEVGHPASEDHWPSITPTQIRAAVWHSLIAGARGITYFNHSFGGPCRTQHALRDPCYASARATVKATNRQIKVLAPVLNAPFVTSRWSHSRTTKAMVKWRGGHFYVFAGSAENVSSTGSFSIPCVGNATATVVGEKRRIPVRRGSFRDTFADGNAVHIYRIDGGSACGLNRAS
jgi:hypothetical protein